MLGIVWKRWNWLDGVLIPFVVSVMQVTCIAPIFAALLRDPSTGIQSTGFVFWLCLGVMLGGAAVGRLAYRNSQGALIVLVGALAAILAALMLIIPPGSSTTGEWFSGVLNSLLHVSTDAMPVPLLTVIFVIFIWWRGLRTIYTAQETLLGMFLIGLLVQLIILFVRFRTLGRFNMALLGQILLFSASSMAAFALNQISHTLSEQERKTGLTLRIDRYWMTTVVSVIIGTLLLGLIIVQIVSPDRFSLLKPLWESLLNIFLLIVFVISYLFFYLLGPLFEELFAGQRSAPAPFLSPFGEQVDLESLERNPIQAPPVLFQIFQVVVILFGIALVVWVLVRALRQRPRLAEQEEGILERRESILSTDLLRAQLGNLLNSLRRQRPQPFLDLTGDEDARRLVRQIYQQVLSRASELNLPRRRGQTPDVYEGSLIALCPEEQASWDIITKIYDIARYSVEPMTLEQVKSAQAAFAQLQTILNAKTTESS